MEERIRLREEYLAYQVANYINTDVETLKQIRNINCYAFARLLGYPDPNQEIYAPGNIYRFKYGDGKILQNSIDLNFIDDCIRRDSQALLQKTTRISFSDIQEQDQKFYFGISLFRFCASKVKHPILKEVLENLNKITDFFDWHFIMRISTGEWLQKPGWERPVEEVKWIEYGKTFDFLTTAYYPMFNAELPLKGICNEKFFYRIEI